MRCSPTKRAWRSPTRTRSAPCSGPWSRGPRSGPQWGTRDGALPAQRRAGVRLLEEAVVAPQREAANRGPRDRGRRCRKPWGIPGLNDLQSALSTTVVEHLGNEAGSLGLADARARRRLLEPRGGVIRGQEPGRDQDADGNGHCVLIADLSGRSRSGLTRHEGQVGVRHPRRQRRRHRWPRALRGDRRRRPPSNRRG